MEIFFADLNGYLSLFQFLSVVYATNAKSLTTKEGRRQWEDAFNTHYIQPVLENLDQMVADAVDKIANDDTQGTDCDVISNI